jgi:hypothetical protein
MLDVMLKFFHKYAGEDEHQHQDEIANTMVYMCLERIDEGVVLIMESNESCEMNQQHLSPNELSSQLQNNIILRDNHETVVEARSLHLALQLGLNMSHTIDAVLDSLVLNINEQRQSANHNLPLVTRNACKKWLLSSLGQNFDFARDMEQFAIELATF